MRARTLWLAGLVAAGLTLAPVGGRAQDSGPAPTAAAVGGGLTPDGGLISDGQLVRAQTPDGELADPEVPIPLGHNPANKGGFFIGSEFVYFHQTNPLAHQPIGYVGFWDADGSVTGKPGTFVGSGQEILNAQMAGGPGTYQPGLRVSLGYAWKDGESLSIEWLHLDKAMYDHEATIVPQNFAFGPSSLQNSFISAPVFNFTNIYAGQQNKIAGGDATATYGIWDGADVMTIQFIQRTESFQGKWKVPIFYNDEFGYRMYGLLGPRFFWIWERFYWRTVDEDISGSAGPTDVANYTNIVSNRMYGVYVGVGNEWYIGHGFACNLDLDAAGLLDVIKERAQYELGQKDFPGQIKRALTNYTVVPEFSATLNLTWYPMENVELRVGYDLMAFFNTIAASAPVSFDVGALNPNWNRQARLFDGWRVGLGITF